MDNTEKQVYDSVCTNYGTLEKFLEQVLVEKAHYENVISVQQKSLEDLMSVCDQYKAISDSFQGMSPPKFTWCWLKSRITKKPVSV